MDGLTINEAAQTTGWSARMLRYVESAGLVSPARSEAGYRLYGAGELQRLATLKELLAAHDVALSDVAFARRLDTDARLRADVQEWLAAAPQRPADVEPGEWLSFEQMRHQRLLTVAA
jgi:DNA-binding transcriptional MerR regulator